MWLVGKMVGSRLTPEDEFAGLDMGEIGVTGYGADGGHPLSPEATTMVR
jgi:Amt family ammonium transporter